MAVPAPHGPGDVIGSLLLWATASSTPALRRLGLVADAVALASRAGRRRRDWAPHEARCHAALRQAVAGLSSRRTVLVLGSGLCRDVPVDDLARVFARVVLVDAVQLLPVRRRYGGRTEMHVADLTGFADDPASGRTDPLATWRGDPTVDLVVSANMLSQMARPFARLLEEGSAKARGWPADLCRRIVAGHLEDLSAFGCTTCLLTDTAYAEIDRAGRVVAEWDLLHGVPLAGADETWDWTVAPPGEIDRTMAFVHRAGVWHDVARHRPDGGWA